MGVSPWGNGAATIVHEGLLQINIYAQIQYYDILELACTLPQTFLFDDAHVGF